MIRVTVELVPHSIEERKRVLGVAKIINDGTGTLTKGNYKVILFSNGVKYKMAEVKGFPRTTTSAWKLLYKSLIACFEAGEMES